MITVSRILYLDFKQSFRGLNKKKTILKDRSESWVSIRIYQTRKSNMTGSKAAVKIDREFTTTALNINDGVRHGHALCTTLFELFLEAGVQKYKGDGVNLSLIHI